MASSELRKLIEKRPPAKKAKDSDSDDSSAGRRSSTPPRRNPLDFTRDMDDNSDTFVLGKRESPRANEGASPMRLNDLLNKSSKKTKAEARSSGKLSPQTKARRLRDDGRPMRTLMTLPDPAYHLRFISSKRTGSQFGNPHVPCLPAAGRH
jgi:hypothetical protein